MHRSRASLAYLIAAMVIDGFASLAAILYALNLWVDGQSTERAARWWNPFHHVHLVRGPIRPWSAFMLLAVCATLGLLASSRATRAPRIAAACMLACAAVVYATGYVTPQPLVLWGAPMCIVYAVGAALLLLAERERTRNADA